MCDPRCGCMKLWSLMCSLSAALQHTSCSRPVYSKETQVVALDKDMLAATLTSLDRCRACEIQGVDALGCGHWCVIWGLVASNLQKGCLQLRQKGSSFLQRPTKIHHIRASIVCYQWSDFFMLASACLPLPACFHMAVAWMHYWLCNLCTYR